MAKYEACATGVLMAVEHQAKKLKVFGDSALVIYQLCGEWETCDSKLIPYHNYVIEMSECFDKITFYTVPKDENQTANALATLSSMLRVNQDQEITIHVWHQVKMAYYQHLDRDEADDKPWYHDIKEYLRKGAYSQGATENGKTTLRRLIVAFFLSGPVLYKRCTDLTLLHYMDDQEAKEIIGEVREGIFGYYWTKMESDCCQHVKRCLKCQVYANNIHVAPSALHNLTSPWPFSMWGLDIIEPIELKASNGHRFILVAIDYFMKWVEVASYANVIKSVVVKFIKKDIIC
ncbi:Gypsy retrotransposon integrase-like protein 1, partial [Mucuna pruriens]